MTEKFTFELTGEELTNLVNLLDGVDEKKSKTLREKFIRISKVHPVIRFLSEGDFASLKSHLNKYNGVTSAEILLMAMAYTGKGIHYVLEGLRR